jgi:hypothetical protein
MEAVIIVVRGCFDDDLSVFDGAVNDGFGTDEALFRDVYRVYDGIMGSC